MRYVLMAAAALLATVTWLDTPGGRYFKKELLSSHADPALVGR